MQATRTFEPSTPMDWHDAALSRAADLRREAMADFWRGADAWLGSAWQRAERAARRLAHRRQRHAMLRAARAACGQGSRA